jgi:ATP-dependent protease ClpP protease subunit
VTMALAKARAAAPQNFGVDNVVRLFGEVVAVAKPGARQITFKAVRQRLEEIRADGGTSVALLIDSNGGLLDEALQIYDAIRSFGGRVSARVVGQCASAANCLLLAADGGREAVESAKFLLHTAAIPPGRGTAAEHKAAASSIAAADRALVKFIASRTSTPLAKIQMAMDLAVPFGSKRALELGLIDRVLDGGTW